MFAMLRLLYSCHALGCCTTSAVFRR